MVHCYRQSGLNIVLDVCSGAVHIVDDLAYDLISNYEEKGEKDTAAFLRGKYGDSLSEKELSECFGQVLELSQKGLLFTKDEFKGKADKLLKKEGASLKALCLHVAHCCNLNCSYCFASQGRYKGERALMSFETGKRALDFLVEKSIGRRNLEVDFFGGEPLMNFETVKALTKYARSIEKEKGKNFRFTLTTNGMLIDDEVISFCNSEMSNVVLSLDGRREVHDRFRKDLEGRGSWDKIVPKFQKLVRARGDGEYYIRGTFTHFNPDFMKDIEAMLDLGFDRLSMEPVVCAKGDPLELRDGDIDIVCGEYEKLTELMIKRRRQGRPFVFYHYMLDLRKGPCIYKRLSGCGSGAEYMAVTPTGELYPCHQFVGNRDFLLGNIRDGVTNKKVAEQFAKCSLYSRPECADCWARFYCSGGCAANAYNATGSVNGIYEKGCTMFKKRIECAVAAEAERLESEG